MQHANIRLLPPTMEDASRRLLEPGPGARARPRNFNPATPAALVWSKAFGPRWRTPELGSAQNFPEVERRFDRRCE
jgi:hypothetical protein